MQPAAATAGSIPPGIGISLLGSTATCSVMLPPSMVMNSARRPSSSSPAPSQPAIDGRRGRE
jgi:hypothetical protein